MATVAGRMTQGDAERRNVLFVLPSLARAGAESQVLDLLESLSGGPWRLHLATFEPATDQLARVQAVGVQHHHIPRRGKWNPSFISGLGRLVDKAQIDIIHATLNIAVLAAWCARTLASRKPPIIAAIHTTTSRNRKDALIGSWLYSPILRRCDAVNFVSHRQREHWLQQIPLEQERTSVIHNGVDTMRFAPSEGDALGRKRPTVVCIAALRPEKGHRILLRAWQGVIAARPDAQLLLVGDGPERGRIEGLIHQYGLAGSVVVLGIIQDVRPILSGAHLTVLPSTAVETLSLAALESLAMGVPVIATAIGGMPEAVLHEQTGLILEPGRPEELATAILELLSDEPRRQVMAANARADMLARFRKERMGEETAALLERVIDNGGLHHALR
ncbi:glycosyltransferase involved in cell wall biosynthesis [Natronocella acetinitrilica]|uniref:Glycosyltransferase involved in cell wall biosynthesis n=2 Tax=Natronocella acetinitrilica TaxID=414046 RepID=A0AAE3KBN0_9GAMM|nr:glycosyltransferase involved in cell wall biosynthesis [Natronocella acetinitrilica]